MTYSNFIDNCKKTILVAHNYDIDRDELYRSLHTVWYCKTLQNYKALIMSTHDRCDDIYWEITYNGSKNKCYVDEYQKKSNTVVTLPEV